MDSSHLISFLEMTAMVKVTPWVDLLYLVPQSETNRWRFKIKPRVVHNAVTTKPAFGRWNQLIASIGLWSIIHLSIHLIKSIENKTVEINVKNIVFLHLHIYNGRFLHHCILVK